MKDLILRLNYLSYITYRLIIRLNELVKTLNVT